MVSVEPDTLVGLVAVVTLPAAALAQLFVSTTAAGVVVIVGWLLLVPTLGILADDEEFSFGSEGEEDQEAASDPLETLRRRYARGELTELEFERRLEHLLETEDIELPPGSSLDSEPVAVGSEPVEVATTDSESEDGGSTDSEPVDVGSTDSASTDATSTTERREENGTLEETNGR